KRRPVIWPAVLERNLTPTSIALGSFSLASAGTVAPVQIEQGQAPATGMGVGVGVSAGGWVNVAVGAGGPPGVNVGVTGGGVVGVEVGAGGVPTVAVALAGAPCRKSSVTRAMIV